MHRGKVVAEKGDYKVIECEVCGFKHLDTIWQKEEIKEYYQSKYYQDKVPKLLDTEKEAREIQWASLSYRDRLVTLNQYIRDTTKKLLDVGCGNGFFLSFMNQNGWETFGIEPSKKASEYARSLGLFNIFNTTLEEFTENKWYGYFDAINFKCILEHVPNPIEILKICRNLLKDSGIVCIEVPNDFNSLQLQIHKSGNPQWWVQTPDHINYFDFDSLEKLLERLNFEIILRTTSFPMELFILMGDNYIENDEIGSNCHQKRLKFDLSITDERRRNMYMSFARLGIGRSCIVYARLKKLKNNGS